MKQKITLFKSLLIIIALSLTGTNTSAQTLVAHYKFDNSISDETTNWNLSAAGGYTPTYETGQDLTPNGAINAFSAAEYLETATDFTPIQGDVSRTMIAWMKMGVTTGQRAWVGLGANSTSAKWTWGPQSAKPRIEITGKGFNITTALAAGTWYHVAVRFIKEAAGGGIRMYVNGDLYTASNNWFGLVNTTLTKLRVGNDYNAATPNRAFEGAIDDLRIYTGGMSDAQILADFNGSVLNVTSTDSESFSVYPNPTKDRLFITSQNVTSVDIYSVSGAKVGSQKIDGSVDMSNLATGVYIIKCNNVEGNTIATVRAVKQ